MAWVNDEWYNDYALPKGIINKEKPKKTLKKPKEKMLKEKIKPVELKTKATLIKLEDQRQILCEHEIANLMLEFAQTFNAQIYTITFNNPEDIKLLDLEETALYICEGKSSAKIPPHQITTILINAEEKCPSEVKNFIAGCLANKKLASVKETCDKFEKINKSIIKEYFEQLANIIKHDNIAKVEFDKELLKVS